MDDRHFAEETGRLLATRTVTHTLTQEASVFRSQVLPYPVGLEPPFRGFDPLHTFAAPQQTCTASPHTPYDWVVRRLILPAVQAVDWRRAEGTIAGLGGCTGPISFEMYAGRTIASYYVGAPSRDIEFVTATWLANYPEGAVVDATDPAQQIPPDTLVYDWCSPAPYQHAIRTSQAVTPWAQFLRLCAHLGDADVLWCQILFAPVQQPWHRNIAAILDAERALGHRAPHGSTTNPKNRQDTLFATAIRVGTTTPAVARSIEAFTGTFTADAKPFNYRTNADYERVITPDDMLAMLRKRTTHTTGQLFTGAELSLLVHPPDLPAAGGVALDFLRGLPVPDSLRGSGVPLGVNTNRGVPVRVFQPDRYNKSRWIIGASGKGKSAKIIHDCHHLATNGYGVGLIDPHRTTAFALLSQLGEVDEDRIVFLDFDAPTSVAYNPFANANSDDHGRLTTEFVHSLKHLFDAAGYHRMTHFLGNAIYALLTLNENLATLPTLFARTPAGEHLRRRVAQEAANETVRAFWQDEYRTHSPEAYAPISNRISALLLDDSTRSTFIQRENRVDVAALMDDRKVLIVAPPASIDAAGIVGGFLIAQAKHAAFRRSGTPRTASHFHLVVDEFHRFITSHNTLESIIDEAAKGGLSVCLANQETGQIPSDLLKAMYSIPNIFVFGVNLPDAKQLSHLFNGYVAPEVLAAQATGDVHARVGGDIVNFTCPLPLRNASPDRTADIIAESRRRYHVTTTSPVARARAPRIIDTFEEL